MYVIAELGEGLDMCICKGAYTCMNMCMGYCMHLFMIRVLVGSCIQLIFIELSLRSQPYSRCYGYSTKQGREGITIGCEWEVTNTEMRIGYTIVLGFKLLGQQLCDWVGHLQVHMHVCVCVFVLEEVGVKGKCKLSGLVSPLLGGESVPERQGDPLFELRSGQQLPLES